MQSSNDNPSADDDDDGRLDLAASPVGARRWIVVLVAAIGLCAAMIWWVAAHVERKDAVAPARAESPDAARAARVEDEATAIRVASALADASDASERRVAARVGSVEILTTELDAQLERHVESLRSRGESPSWVAVEGRRRAMLEARIEDVLVRQALAPAAAAVDATRVEAALDARIAARFGGRRDRFERYLSARGLRQADVELEVRHELALRDKLAASGGALDEGLLARTWQSLAPTLEAPARARVDLVRIDVPDEADEPTMRRLRGDARALQRTMSSRRPGASLARLAERYGAVVELDGDWAMSGELTDTVEHWLWTSGDPTRGVARVLEPLEVAGTIRVARVYEQRPAGVRRLDEVRDLVVERALGSRADAARHQLAVVSAMTVPIERADARWHRRLQRRVAFERTH